MLLEVHLGESYWFLAFWLFGFFGLSYLFVATATTLAPTNLALHELYY